MLKILKGGPGSGHHGHGGLKGVHGGSTSSRSIKSHKELISQDPPKSSAQAEAIDRYVSGGYLSINGYLRHNEDVPDHMKEHAKQLQAYGNSTSLSVPTVVYRGVKPDILEKITASVGGTFTDAGFMSASYDKDLAVGRSYKSGYLEIRTPAGSKAFAGNSFEDELIFNAGTSMRILEVGSDFVLNSEVIKVVAEVIND